MKDHQQITFYKVKEDDSKKKRFEVVQSACHSPDEVTKKSALKAENILQQNAITRDLDTPCFERGVIFNSGGSLSKKKSLMEAYTTAKFFEENNEVIAEEISTSAADFDAKKSQKASTRIEESIDTDTTSFKHMIGGLYPIDSTSQLTVNTMNQHSAERHHPLSTRTTLNANRMNNVDILFDMSNSGSLPECSQ